MPSETPLITDKRILTSVVFKGSASIGDILDDCTRIKGCFLSTRTLPLKSLARITEMILPTLSASHLCYEIISPILARIRRDGRKIELIKR